MIISKKAVHFVSLTIVMLLFAQKAIGLESGQVPKNTLASSQFLEKQVLQFEHDYYSTCSMDSAQFSHGTVLFESLIYSYLSINSQYPDSSFGKIAFTYVEKLKSLKIFHQFSASAFSDSDRIEYCEYFTQNYNQRQNNYAINSKIENPEKPGKDHFDLLKENETSLLDTLKNYNQNLLMFLSLQQPITVSYLQHYFLNGHEALIDYWFHKNEIYVFIVTVDSFYTVHWDAPVNEVKNKAWQLITPLTGIKNLLRLEFDYHLAHQLYQTLFEPIEPYIEQFQVVLLIPDDFLAGFPFEALVTDTTITKKIDKDIYYHQYSKLTYLTNKYAFCYNLSVAGLLPVPPHQFSPKKLGRRLLTMSEPVLHNNKLSAIPVDRTELLLKPSDFTSDEIKRVSRLLWRHDNLKKEQATKNELLKIGNSYRWIYLALPGLLDNVNPMNSGIIFTADSNNISNWFSAREITRSFLTSDMLTLSTSKITPHYEPENPGVFTLPQSFLFSGVKSVLFSLWDINSISTSQFMSKFYWELKYKRQTNVLALQEAKIASMKDVLEFSGRQISKAHPYFWASFELIGNPKIRPPSTTIIPFWGVIIIVYIVVIGSALIITRKTLPTRKV